MLEDVLDRLVEQHHCYPKLWREREDVWACHLGFGNRRKGIIVYACSPLAAVLGAENEADHG